MERNVQSAGEPAVATSGAAATREPAQRDALRAVTAAPAVSPLGDAVNPRVFADERREAAALDTGALITAIGELIRCQFDEVDLHETLARLAMQRLPDTTGADDSRNLLGVLWEKLEAAHTRCCQVAGRVEELAARAARGDGHA